MRLNGETEKSVAKLSSGNFRVGPGRVKMRSAGWFFPGQNPFFSVLARCCRFKPPDCRCGFLSPVSLEDSFGQDCLIMSHFGPSESEIELVYFREDDIKSFIEANMDIHSQADIVRQLFSSLCLRIPAGEVRSDVRAQPILNPLSPSIYCFHLYDHPLSTQMRD
jgi:hypothetical protein